MATSESNNTDLFDENNVSLKVKILSGDLKISQKRGRSKVWNVFGNIENMSGDEIPNFVACKNCFNVYKCANKSTSNLLKHKCYIEAVNLPENISRVQVNPEIKTKLLNIFTEWTLENCRPFKIVEDTGFIKIAVYLLSIGARYGQNVDIKNLLPHPTTLSRNITNVYYNHFEKVKAEISSFKNNGFGLTSDLWKDDFLKKSYLSLTIQYIKEGILVSRLLGMKCMKNEKCTSDKVYTKVCAILKEFDLILDYKAIIVTDRGSNMVAAFRKNNHIYCIDHMLHNTVQKSMQDVRDVAEISRVCTKLVKYFKVSGLNSTLNTTLKSFSPTRWNSIYTLLVSVEENWHNIIQILKERNEEYKIHNIELSHINAIIKTLAPFQEAFTKLEGEKYPTIHLVYMIVHHLQKKCNPDSSDMQIAKQLKVKLGYYLDTIVLQNLTIYHKIAVFLFPPANKLIKFSDEEKAEIKEECRRIMTNYQQEIPEAENGNIGSAECAIGEFYSDYIQVPQYGVSINGITSEISKYESFNLLNFSNDFNVLQWWNLHKAEYPLLYKLSCQILATPASSAASERVFSAARNLISEKRSSLAFNDECINAIMFLHSNVKLN